MTSRSSDRITDIVVTDSLLEQVSHRLIVRQEVTSRSSDRITGSVVTEALFEQVMVGYSWGKRQQVNLAAWVVTLF